MNDFKDNLKVNIESITKNSKKIDKKIRDTISHELSKLELSSDVPEYGRHIRNRKNGILYIFKNFNYNMKIIENYRKYQSSNSSHSSDFGSYKIALDRIIKRKLQERLEKIYTRLSKNKNTDACKSVSNQLKDRQLRLGILLDDYDKNMEALEMYKKTVKNSQNKQHVTYDEK